MTTNRDFDLISRIFILKKKNDLNFWLDLLWKSMYNLKKNKIIIFIHAKHENFICLTTTNARVWQTFPLLFYILMSENEFNFNLLEYKVNLFFYMMWLTNLFFFLTFTYFIYFNSFSLVVAFFLYIFWIESCDLICIINSCP